MIRDKTMHHENIIEAAMAEFLEYGFKDASMRRIASAAGMSVSGLYKHFASKEDMFAALVEPACEGLLALFRQEATDQKQFIGTGDLSTWENGSDAKLAVSYIYDHLDAFRLIVCKSQGTKYENFVHDLAVILPGLDVLDSLLESGQRAERVDDDLAGIGVGTQK